MNIIDAAHKTVRDYPGGSESLAPRIGMSAAVLRNKVNPNNTTHHLTLAEADDIMAVSADFRILHALAGQHGFVLHRLDSPDSGSLVEALLMAAAGQGDLARIVAEAIADGRITPNEASSIGQACALIQAALVAVSMHASAAPRAAA